MILTFFSLILFAYRSHCPSTVHQSEARYAEAEQKNRRKIQLPRQWRTQLWGCYSFCSQSFGTTNVTRRLCSSADNTHANPNFEKVTNVFGDYLSLGNGDCKAWVALFGKNGVDARNVASDKGGEQVFEGTQQLKKACRIHSASLGEKPETQIQSTYPGFWSNRFSVAGSWTTQSFKCVTTLEFDKDIKITHANTWCDCTAGVTCFTPPLLGGGKGDEL